MSFSSLIGYCVVSYFDNLDIGCIIFLSISTTLIIVKPRSELPIRGCLPKRLPALLALPPFAAIPYDEARLSPVASDAPRMVLPEASSLASPTVLGGWPYPSNNSSASLLLPLSPAPLCFAVLAFSYARIPSIILKALTVFPALVDKACSSSLSVVPTN